VSFLLNAPKSLDHWLVFAGFERIISTTEMAPEGKDAELIG
jgi:hypothetical protein